jgi:hypothetical protein
MTDIDRLYEQKQKKKIKKFKKKIRKGIFSKLYTDLLSKDNPYYDKNKIPDTLIAYFYTLDIALKGEKGSNSKGIYHISLMPNFDGEKGYIITFDPNSKLTSKMFDRQKGKIGRVLCSYKIKRGSVDTEIKDIDIMIPTMLTDGSGPTILDKRVVGVVHDKENWYQSLSMGDHINLIVDSSDVQNFNLVIESTAEKSSLELYNMILEKEKSGSFTMKDLVNGKSQLSHVYNTHIKNSKRNNGRMACESQRFFKVGIECIKDPYAYNFDNPLLGKPRVGVSDTTQYSNVINYHESFDPKQYHKYTVANKSNVNVGLYSDKSNMSAMSYSCGTFYFPNFRIENTREAHENEAWSMWMKFNKYGQFKFFDILSNRNTRRFIAFPKKFVDFETPSDTNVPKVIKTEQDNYTAKSDDEEEDQKRKKVIRAEKYQDYLKKSDETTLNTLDKVENEKKDKYISPYEYHLSKIGGKIKKIIESKITSGKMLDKRHKSRLCKYISASQNGVELKTFNNLLSIKIKE